MKRTILLVEDDSNTLKALTAFLEQEYTVISAPDGVEAIFVYDQHENDISAVVTDWIMPRLNGDNLIAWLRAKHPSLPVILMSAHELERICASGFVPPSEGFEYIQKPFNLTKLLKKMEQIIGGTKAEQYKPFQDIQKKGTHKLDTSLLDYLYREFMGRCRAIEAAIGKYDLLLDDNSVERWKELKQQFWSEYVYPKFEETYFQIFRYDNEKHNPDRFKGELSILEYSLKMDIALCAWLRRDGFFHLFRDELFFINPDPTDMAFILTNGVPFRRYPPEYFGPLLERVAIDGAMSHNKIERLGAWLGGLALLAVVLLWIWVSNTI
jgi:DNA-binding response OmpR family regulator